LPQRNANLLTAAVGILGLIRADAITITGKGEQS